MVVYTEEDRARYKEYAEIGRFRLCFVVADLMGGGWFWSIYEGSRFKTGGCARTPSELLEELCEHRPRAIWYITKLSQ